MNFLCKLNIHLPVTVDQTLFIDRVNHKEVYLGRCKCGLNWMHQSICGWPIWFKCRRKEGQR